MSKSAMEWMEGCLDGERGEGEVVVGAPRRDPVDGRGVRLPRECVGDVMAGEGCLGGSSPDMIMYEIIQLFSGSFCFDDVMWVCK